MLWRKVKKRTKPLRWDGGSQEVPPQFHRRSSSGNGRSQAAGGAAGHQDRPSGYPGASRHSAWRAALLKQQDRELDRCGCGRRGATRGLCSGPLADGVLPVVMALPLKHGPQRTVGSRERGPDPLRLSALPRRSRPCCNSCARTHSALPPAFYRDGSGGYLCHEGPCPLPLHELQRAVPLHALRDFSELRQNQLCLGLGRLGQRVGNAPAA
jgi:hypothetical protein